MALRANRANAQGESGISRGVIADYVSQAVLNRIDDSITAGDEQRRVGTPIVFEWVPLKKSYLIRQLGEEIYPL